MRTKDLMFSFAKPMKRLAFCLLLLLGAFYAIPAYASCSNTSIGNGVTCTISISGQSSDGGTSASTGSFTSSGNLEIISVTQLGWNSNSAPCAVADNKNATVTQLGTANMGRSVTSIAMYYVSNPIVGTGHVITCTGATSFPTISVAFYTTPSTYSFDVQNSGIVAAPSSSVSTGSITPNKTTSLIVGGCASGSVSPDPATMSNLITAEGVTVVGGEAFAGTLAHVTQGSASAISSTCTETGDTTSGVAAIIAAFDPPCTSPSKLVFTSQPTSTAVGNPLGAVTAVVEDSGGSVCRGSTASITLSKDGSATWGTLNSASSLTKSADGVTGSATWTANDLTVTGATGTGSIDASSSGLTTAISNSITIRATGCSGSSPSWTASTWADVQTCHTNASNGDTITVLAGTYSATTNIQITKFVHIVAPLPVGSVVLSDDITACAMVNPCGFGPTQTMITFTPSSAGSSSFENFTINEGLANQVNEGGALAIYGSPAKPVVFKNNTINDLGLYGNFTWFYVHMNQGVIAANTFHATPTTFPPGSGNCSTQVQFLQVEPDQQGTDWATQVPYGSLDTNGDQMVYVEGNTILRGGLTDNLSNGRTTYRYNTVSNTNVGIHGIAFVNGRYLDAYNNLWIDDLTLHPQGCDSSTSGSSQSFNGFITPGAGEVLVHHNTIPVANTIGFGTKAAINVTADTLRRDGGGWPCWNTLTGIGDGYPSPELFGWGYLTASHQTVCPASASCDATRMANAGPQDQSLTGSWFWQNTGGGTVPSFSDYDPTTSGGGGSTNGCATVGAPAPYPSISTYVVEGREWYNDADQTPPGSGKPGYTAFMCPHPATGYTGCDSTTNGVTAYNTTSSGSSQSFSSQPTNTVSGNLFSPTISVTVSPPAGDSITLSIASGTCTLTGGPLLTITSNAGTGIAPFAGVGVSATGTGCVIRAHNNTDATVADILSAAFNVAPAPTGVSAARRRLPRAHH